MLPTIKVPALEAAATLQAWIHARSIPVDVQTERSTLHVHDVIGRWESLTIGRSSPATVSDNGALGYLRFRFEFR